MTGRKVWEEDLWTTNAPLPSRPWAEGHPRVKALPRGYVVEGEPLWPWTLHSLAPLDLARSWLPLPPDHESAWLHRNGKVRHGLIDLANGVVVTWRLTAGSKAYQPRSRLPSPERNPS